MLANLKKRRVFRRFDKVSGRIDEIEPRLAPLALTAKEDRGVGPRALALQGLTVAALHLQHRLAENLRGAIKRRRVEDRLNAVVVAPLGDRRVDPGQNALCYRQVAGAAGDQRAFARRLPRKHLLVAGNVIHPRIRPGVGHHDEARIQFYAHTISHLRIAPRKPGLLLRLDDLHACFQVFVRRPGDRTT